MNKRLIGGLTLVLAMFAVIILFAWWYTNLVATNARAKGEYASPEEGMLALIDQSYSPDRTVKISYAGPDAPGGRYPYVWYVIAEVRASSRIDGSQLGHSGCDNPGLLFVQLKDGKWVHVPEGWFITLVPYLMGTFELAGDGQSTPTIDLLSGEPTRFCQ